MQSRPRQWIVDCRMSETEPGVRIKYVRRPRERMAPTAAGRLAGAVRSALHRCYTNASRVRHEGVPHSTVYRQLSVLRPLILDSVRSAVCSFQFPIARKFAYRVPGPVQPTHTIALDTGSGRPVSGLPPYVTTDWFASGWRPPPLPPPRRLRLAQRAALVGGGRNPRVRAARSIASH